MPVVATPARRRLVMAVLLLLAAAGAVIRWQAPAGSVLRDVGTLLMVLWLPAVGNLVAWLIGKLPKRAPRVTAFAPGSPFVAHLRAELQPTGDAAALAAAHAPAERRCTLVVGTQAFTARLDVPLAQALAGGRSQVALQLLRPEVGLPQLPAGTVFHLCVGTTAAAQGQVLA